MRKYNIDMNELRTRRKKLGLTQEQVAKACGVSRRTYQTYEETNAINATFDELLRRLDEMGVLDGGNYIASIKGIKFAARSVFSKHPEVRCAYLYGSYARGEATGKSDIDILVVCHDMGLDFFDMGLELSEMLHKEIDLQTHDQIVDSSSLIEDILVEGIKIYDKFKNTA